MEGSIFYWVYWFLWTYFTFIMDKHNPYRLKLAALILILIISSPSHFSIKGFDFYVSGLLLLLSSYLVMRKEKLGTLLYQYICSLIISIAYVTFHLFEIFDPIWIIFNKDWMIAICMWYLTLLLQRSIKGRLVTVICGTMQGEIMYAYILSKYQFSYEIGGFSYLDVCSLIIVFITAWSILENLGVILQNQFPFFGRIKQKSSGNRF